MDWKDKFPKTVKPPVEELLAFFEPNIRNLFLSFDGEMRERFKVVNKHHRYAKAAGWTYGYGRSYNCELLAVTVQSDCFRVLGVDVRDDASLQKALEEAGKAYNNGYEERFAEISEKRRANQSERAKARTSREKLELSELIDTVNPEKLNKFKWCRKVSRNDLLRLYNGEARGLLDEELLEEVGTTFYTRCTQSKDAQLLLSEGKMRCHHCGRVLQATGYATVTHCECGYCYTYREYRRSFNANNMPANRAQPIFDAFMERWPACLDATAKMLLIDWLIHEFHVTLMSGEQGRSVCANLIEGTKKQISDMILQLAYGDSR